MSALFDQFVVEARELLESAGASLLRLERAPTDVAAVNDLFRALHTLKGATGLFDMAPFTHLVHAGEDALMALRDGRSALSPELADRLFQLFDLASHWVERVAEERTLPDGAAAMAAEQEALLRAARGDGIADATDSKADPTFAWLEAPSDAELRAAGGRAVTAVAYDPVSDCFFSGDDPLALMRRIPQLVALRIEPMEPWPPLAEIDPYRSVLRFRALSTAPREEVEPVFRAVPDQVRLATVVPSAPDAAATLADGGDLATAMLRTQARILRLGDTGDGEVPGRGAAARRAARAILTATGRADDLAAFDRAFAEPPEALARLVEGLADPPPAAAPAASASPVPMTAGRRTLRVDAERVDRLMALVGELVVAKGRLPFLAREARNDGTAGDALLNGLREAQMEIDGLVGALRDAVLRLRLLPLDRVFEPLPRLVRDTARRLGKTVELRLDGGGTEADKDILDVLGEPLLHLVRNSLDHGIETPEARRAAGKPESAVIRVSARQDRDGVVVEVSDDGAGIDADAVRRKAVARGLIEAEAAVALSEEEAARLIFLPGLSTASDVSDLSGRGVGMDAVRAAVERAGGRVELSTERGAGTWVRLLLPATIMISRVLVVETAGTLYGVPVTLVAGTQRVRASAIRRVKHAESMVFQDAVLPLLRLRRLLGLPEAEGGDDRGEAVLVVDIGGERVALVVDALRERADVVLKPMTGVLARLRGYTGTAVLGDGRLLLVLNVRELV